MEGVRHAGAIKRNAGVLHVPNRVVAGFLKFVGAWQR
jgi:hypothetical protein